MPAADSTPHFYPEGYDVKQTTPGLSIPTGSVQNNFMIATPSGDSTPCNGCECQKTRVALWCCNFCLSCFLFIPSFILGIIVLTNDACKYDYYIFPLNHQLGVFLLVSSLVTCVCSPFSFSIKHPAGKITALYYLFMLAWNIWGTVVLAQNSMYCFQPSSWYYYTTDNGLAFVSAAVFCSLIWLYLVIVPVCGLLSCLKNRPGPPGYDPLSPEWQQV